MRQLIQSQGFTDEAIGRSAFGVHGCLRLLRELLADKGVRRLIDVTKAALKLEGGDELACVMLMRVAVGGGGSGHARVP